MTFVNARTCAAIGLAAFILVLLAIASLAAALIVLGPAIIGSAGGGLLSLACGVQRWVPLDPTGGWLERLLCN